MRPKYLSLVKRFFFSPTSSFNNLKILYSNTVYEDLLAEEKKNYTWNSLELYAGKELILNALVTIR